MVCTQLPALYLYYRWVYPPAGRAGVGTQDRCRTALALLGVAPGLVRSPPCPPTHPACLPACLPTPCPARCSNVMMSVSHYGRLTPLQGTLEAPTAAIDPATFLPPPLRKGAVGWYPEWGKVRPAGGSDAARQRVRALRGGGLRGDPGPGWRRLTTAAHAPAPPRRSGRSTASGATRCDSRPQAGCLPLFASSFGVLPVAADQPAVAGSCRGALSFLFTVLAVLVEPDTWHQKAPCIGSLQDEMWSG